MSVTYTLDDGSTFTVSGTPTAATSTVTYEQAVPGGNHVYRSEVYSTWSGGYSLSLTDSDGVTVQLEDAALGSAVYVQPLHYFGDGASPGLRYCAIVFEQDTALSTVTETPYGGATTSVTYYDVQATVRIVDLFDAGNVVATYDINGSFNDGYSLYDWDGYAQLENNDLGEPPPDHFYLILRDDGDTDAWERETDGGGLVVSEQVNDSPRFRMFTLAADPSVAHPVPNQEILEDGSWTYQVPPDTFFDRDGDTLAYDATLSNGDPLPVWLSFDPATRTFTGSPPPDFNGSLNIRVTASDGTATSGDVFTLTIAPVNDAPELATPIANQGSAEDALWQFQVPAGTFADIDGDTLTYSATLANGDPLPGWLSFDPATRTFSGTPPENFTGSIDVTVVADDGTVSVSDTFTVTIQSVADSPRLDIPIADQGGVEDDAWQFQVPDDSFSDGDGDTLTWSATLADGSALPAWLSFDPATRTFSGTPPPDFNGDIDLKVIAGDGVLTASNVFRLSVAPANDAPELVTPLEDQTVAEEDPWSFQVPDDAFDDIDGDALAFVASLADGSPLPSWMSFDTATRTFSGTPPANFHGALDIKVTAGDGSLSASDEFRLTVTAANDPPAVLVPIADQEIQEDGSWSFQVPAGAFGDDDGDTLAFTATLGDGSPLPAWLTFDGATRTFSGAPPPDTNGSVDLKVTASDGSLSVSDTFRLTVNPVNDAPHLVAAIADHETTEDEAWSFQVPAGTFGDVDGDTLSWSATLGDGSALPSWLAFAPATRTFSGTPPANFAGSLDLRVTVSDGAASRSDDFTLVIAPADDPVTGSLSISGTTADEGLLTASHDFADSADGIAAVALQWQRQTGVDGNGDPTWEDLAGATGATLALDEALLGMVLRVRATITDGQGFTANRVSAATAAIGAGDDLLIGTAGADYLSGFTGSDLLRGLEGNDILDGGDGTDTADFGEKTAAVSVVLSGASDAIVFVNGVAEDTVRNIENVIGGAGADTLVGDGLANRLLGMNGNDLLRGMGGADFLDGGAGSDLADYSDKSASVVVTLAGATDAVVTVAGAAEDTLRNVENVTGGAGADQLFGDQFANTLAGSGGNDLLRGGGGVDFLDGGAGSDTADFGDKALPVTVTLNGAAYASVRVGGVVEDYVRNIENVVGGSGRDVLTGNALANVLNGGGGDDQLNGGLGKDVLLGGAGRDRFLFNTAPSRANVDAISDFRVVDDTILIENAIFRAFPRTGVMYFSAFWKGVAAHDADDRIIYNPATGALLYDANGNGSGGAVLVAVLPRGLALTNQDFLIV